MNSDLLTVFRKEIAGAAANLKKCDATYKGFRAFKGNHQGLEFCATQMLHAAIALREHAELLVQIAEDIQNNFGVVPQPEATYKVSEL